MLRCPYCSSRRVHRSQSQGPIEGLILPLIFIQPFRCMKCWRRYYDFKFRKHSLALLDSPPPSPATFARSSASSWPERTSPH